MPITDITVNALFAVNEYTLLYIVDDEEYNKKNLNDIINVIIK